MKEKVKKAKLLRSIDIDKIIVKRDAYFTKAYITDLPLDSTPDHVWQDIFEQKWKSSRHLWDRKLYVVGDKLRLLTTANDLEEKLDWVEQVIKETNKAVDEFNRTIKKEEMDRQEILEEKARLETFRDTLRKRFA